MVKNKGRYLLVMLLIVGLDQLSKWLIQSQLNLYGTRELLPGFFRLWHVRNPGAVWGILSQHSSGLVPKVITGLSILALGLVAYFFVRVEARCRLELLVFSFILGGAIGNIIDRLRMGFVVDFLDLYIGRHHWPTFNLADSFIFVGTILLAWALWRGTCTRF